MVDSRGAVDTALLQELLAEPLNYVILDLNNRKKAIYTSL